MRPFNVQIHTGGFIFVDGVLSGYKVLQAPSETRVIAFFDVPNISMPRNKYFLDSQHDFKAFCADFLVAAPHRLKTPRGEKE